MKLTKKLTLGLLAAGAVSSVSAADLTLTIGHVDPQDWSTSKKAPLPRYLKTWLKQNPAAVLK
ncbi:hypothetical protein N5P32_08590 [Marinomonas pontica]|uniref:hypothetical protein n=1 Tax=Marinomonas pontica TaxID=264739 RepID=UPI0022437D14|nr:hypothetical protein [Marinomonas pontica]MCW8355940.1 hypothetical protein [Marinomonas pontica]